MGIGAAVGGIVGGLFQKSAANKATAAQTKAADQQIDFQKEIYADQTQRFAPFLGGGTNALAALNFEMGLGARPMIGGTPAAIETISGASRVEPIWETRGRNDNRVQVGTREVPGASRFRVNGREFATMDEAAEFAAANRTGGTEYGGFTKTPGYEFRRQQGIDAIDASAATRGGLMSGRTLQDLTTFGDGIASQEYGTYMNRLSGLTDMGMGAAGMQATAGNNAAAGVNAALANKGNAQAAGAIAGGNAMAGMVNNLSGAFGYMTQPKVGGGFAFGGGR